MMNITMDAAERSVTIIGNDSRAIVLIACMGSPENDTVEVHGHGFHTEYNFNELERRLRP